MPWEQYPGQRDEQAVLGAIFRYGQPALHQTGNLHYTCFYDWKHQIVHDAQRRAMHGQDEVERVLSVGDALCSTGQLAIVGSYIYLAELESYNPYTHEIAPWAARIFERWREREARIRSSEVCELLDRGHSLDDVLIEAVARLDTLRTLTHEPLSPVRVNGHRVEPDRPHDRRQRSSHDDTT
jgi:replicative DNA helicase